MLLGGATIVDLILTRIAEDLRPWRSTVPVAEFHVEFLAALREARSD